jgi:mannose-1-phosphate guanylyltransferase/mannose-6-phosphate isomerase
MRVSNTIPAECIWVVTAKEQEFVVQSQLLDLPGFEGERVHILVEPLPRNTAAAVGLAAVHIQRLDPRAEMAVLPADHWIERQSDFVALIQRAASLACRGHLVTLGVVPDRPETGYGYIRRGELVHSSLSSQVDSLHLIDLIDAIDPTNSIDLLEAYHVKEFVEKPDLSSARQYVVSKKYYWNAGVFVWQVSMILEEIAAHLPLLGRGLSEIACHLDRDNVKEVVATVYSRLDAVSIDYGVLEKSTRLVVVPADIGWSDLGDWTTVHRLSVRDERGNALSANVFDLDSENSFVHGNGRLIATIGLKDTVVIDTDDALLVCPTNRVQEVKTIVHQLQERKTEAVYASRTVHRPWGTYTVLEEGPSFKVKRIVVNPGAALSLQLHRHRSEHWVVVTGSAQVTNGELECRLEVGQSAYVPQQTRHRLSNPGSEPLEIIEVQTGSYLGEDDIIRFDDLYHRLSA